MIRCLCCTRVGEPVIRTGSAFLENVHDRAPTKERVQWQACSFCYSDLVEDVVACRTCGARPAECDDDCVECTVEAIRATPEQFNFAAPFWKQPGWDQAAARVRQQVAA